jgi:hypothetical protein
MFWEEEIANAKLKRQEQAHCVQGTGRRPV